MRPSLSVVLLVLFLATSSSTCAQEKAPPEQTASQKNESGETDMPADFSFRIVPVRPIDEVREEALKLSPPEEKGSFRDADLVELIHVDSTIALNIRYATDQNFMGTVLYEEARAFMQRPAAEAVGRVQESLAKRGIGLVIYDAYRPWYVTKMFWEATPPSQREFVANPAKGSKHNRGCAVDLGLIDLSTGEILDMPSGYDEFSKRAYANYDGGTETETANRELLRREMEAVGFRVNPGEWWHFDYQDWDQYRIQNVRFADIDSDGKSNG